MNPLTCLVLVCPQNPGNIGAVARAMMNMALSDLRLVLPQCDPLSRESLDRAREATPIVRTAKLFINIDDAVADCHRVYGTSRKARSASPDFVTPRVAAKLIYSQPKIKSALIFGPEDRGLNNEEIQKCDVVIDIPSAPAFPSLNLSHAVMVVLYELFVFESPTITTKNKQRKIATAKDKEGFYEHLREALLKINYLDANNPERIMRTMRNIFGRAELDIREVDILRGVCRQILNRTVS